MDNRVTWRQAEELLLRLLDRTSGLTDEERDAGRALVGLGAGFLDDAELDQPVADDATYNVSGYRIDQSLG